MDGKEEYMVEIILANLSTAERAIAQARRTLEDLRASLSAPHEPVDVFGRPASMTDEELESDFRRMWSDL